MNQKQNSLPPAETIYQMIFLAQNQELTEFTEQSWRLTSEFINSIKDKNLNDIQKSAMFCLFKSQRLLKSIYNLIMNGFWAESQPIHRTLIENQLILNYILQDQNGKRAKKWLAGTEWKIRTLMEASNEIFKDYYNEVSLYTHNNAKSLNQFIKFNKDKFIMSPGPNYEHSEFASLILGHAAMTNTSICEISAETFSLKKNWEKQYQKLISLPYYKKEYSDALKFMSANKEVQQKINSFLKEINLNKNEVILILPNSFKKENLDDIKSSKFNNFKIKLLFKHNPIAEIIMAISANDAIKVLNEINHKSNNLFRKRIFGKKCKLKKENNERFIITFISTNKKKFTNINLTPLKEKEFYSALENLAKSRIINDLETYNGSNQKTFIFDPVKKILKEEIFET